MNDLMSFEKKLKALISMMTIVKADQFAKSTVSK